MQSRLLTITSVELVSESRLSKQQATHLKVARLVAAWYNSDEIRISRVVAAKVTVLERGVMIDGLYSTYTKTVYLAPHVLEYIDTTIDTLIHEIAHHRTQAPDGAKVHEDEIENVSQRVINEIKSGTLYGKLKGVAWSGGQHGGY